MPSTSLTTLLLLLLHLLFLTSNACQNTKHNKLCIFFSSLKSNPTTSNTDIKNLARTIVRLGIKNATATSAYLSSSSSSSSSNDTVLRKVMGECADKYKLSSDALRLSERDLVAENYDSAHVQVSAAAEYPDACRSVFGRSPGLVYPTEVAEREDALVEVCDLLLGIVDYIISIQFK